MQDRLDSLSGLHVLVVDDNEDIRCLLSYALKRYSAAVTVAESGIEALTEFEKLRPDVLVIDLNMPEMDGYVFMSHVRALPPAQGGQIPAIAFTSYNSPEHRQRAFAAGYQRYVVKSADPEELASAIASLTGRDQQPT